MKLSKKPSSKENDVFKSIKKYIKTEREMFSFMMTYMGMMHNMLDFLCETYGNPERMRELPELTKYAMANAIMQEKFLIQMSREEIDPQIVDIRHLPIEEDGWGVPKKISDKIVLVVKELYKQLKDEGLIDD